MEKLIGNNISVGENNRKRVIKLLYKNDFLTKQEIVDKLNLSLPTVTQNLKKLIDCGLVCETGKLESTGGRKPMLLSLNKESNVSMGVEISKNHIRIVIVNLLGEIIFKQKLLCEFENSDKYFTSLKHYIDCAFENVTYTNFNILGVGIAFPGTVEKNTKTILFAPTLDISPKLDIKSLDIEKALGDFNYKLLVDNEAKAAGFAEVYGIESIRNAIFLSITKGVGGSIIFDNKVYSGQNCKAGEFGHITLVPNGNKCSCGKFGCFEAYCSTKILAENGSMLEKFFVDLKNGDSKCIEKWNSYLDYLSLGIHNIMTIFDSELLIGGDLAQYLEEYLPELKERIMKLSSVDLNLDNIRICRFHDYSSSVGVALMFIDEFING